MGAMASQITSLTIVKENIKVPRYWPLWGEFTAATGEFPSQMASNAENASIWWRHHGNVSYSPHYQWSNLVRYG